jgi:outer membrane protein OmpA-like peptidoglycan-associated protein
MEKHLDAHGKAAIYGIYFDFDKAVVKPESRAQLEQMAGFLKARADVKVFIVGHTDNKGSFDYNLKLSQQRAEAVVAALVKDFGIASERLSAKGVAGLAPVTSNSTEAGCSKNRRVEMVLR